LKGTEVVLPPIGGKDAGDWKKGDGGNCQGKDYFDKMGGWVRPEKERTFCKEGLGPQDLG